LEHESDSIRNDFALAFDATRESHVHSAGNIVVGISLGAVVLVLLAGLVNMLRGGSSNVSQKLMRWRVGLQFLTIVIIMGVLWLRGG
jgi:hypothetical protein